MSGINYIVLPCLAVLLFLILWRTIVKVILFAAILVCEGALYFRFGGRLVFRILNALLRAALWVAEF